MLLSIIVYTLTAALLCVFGWHYNKRVNEKLIDVNDWKAIFSWEILACIILFTLVAGMRYYTGWDWACYCSNYWGYQGRWEPSRPDFEIGFVVISKLIASTGAHFSIFFAFWALTQIGFLYYALRKKPFLLPWIGLCIMLGPFFMHWMNSMRQGIVECMLVAMVIFIEKRKFWIYCVFTLLAMTIHRSAILFFPFYALAIVPYRIKGKYTPLIIYLVCVIVGQFPVLYAWTINAFGNLLHFYGYGKYVTLYNTTELYSFHNTPFGILSTIYVLTHLWIIYIYPKIKAFYNNDEFLKISFRFVYFYQCYFVLTSDTSCYFKRPGEFLLCFFLIMMAYVMAYLWNTRRYYALAGFATLSLSTVYVNLIKGYFNLVQGLDTYFYHFIPL